MSEASIKCGHCGFQLRPPRSGKDYVHTCEICKSYRGQKVIVTRPDGQKVDGFLCKLCINGMPEDFKVEIIED